MSIINNSNIILFISEFSILIKIWYAIKIYNESKHFMK